MRKKVSINGCCVSRDVFNYDVNKHYEVENFRQLDPISFQFTEKLIIPSEQFEQFKFRSNFIRNCAEHVCNKDTVGTLLGSDMLILDCADERIPKALIKSSCEGAETPGGSGKIGGGYAKHIYFDAMTAYFKSLGVCQEIRFNALDWGGVQEAYRTYAEKITDISTGGYNQKDIYIIEVFMANSYIDEKHNIYDYNIKNSPFSQEYINSVNIYLRKIYDLLEGLLPDAKIVKLPPNLITVSYHRWGLNPLHFAADVYQYIFNCIEVMSGASNMNSVEAMYEELRLRNYIIYKIGNRQDK